MKKLIMMLSVLPALLFSTAAVTAPYWTEKPTVCALPEEVMQIAASRGEYPTIVLDGMFVLPGEVPSLVPSKWVIATNEETGTWTLLEFPKGSNMACIIGRGSGHIELLSRGTST